MKKTKSNYKIKLVNDGISKGMSQTKIAKENGWNQGGLCMWLKNNFILKPGCTCNKPSYYVEKDKK